jgi:hypothetical protein
MQPDRLLRVSTTTESRDGVASFPGTICRRRRPQLSTGHHVRVYVALNASNATSGVGPFWVEPANPRWLVDGNDDSNAGSSPSPSDPLNGIPSRILGYHLSAPLQGLRVSRYPGGSAFPDTPQCRGLHPASVPELSLSFRKAPTIPRIASVSMERVAAPIPSWAT